MIADCNLVNAHSRDAGVTFEPLEHKYTIDGYNGPVRSVTEVVEDSFERFDEVYWSERKAPGMGITPEELRRRWREKAEKAAALGTEMHDRIERYYNGEDCMSDDPAYRLFKIFASAVQLHPYRTEWRIYDEDYGVAGTLDFITRDPSDGRFEIFDWKRTDRIIEGGAAVTVSRYGKSGLHPVAHVPDCTYMHYALQVSIYRYILERKYGINVVRGRLGIFHPSYSRPYIVDVPYLRSEAAAVISHRR